MGDFFGDRRFFMKDRMNIRDLFRKSEERAFARQLFRRAN
jgi:hypothetical protein